MGYSCEVSMIPMEDDTKGQELNSSDRLRFWHRFHFESTLSYVWGEGDTVELMSAGSFPGAWKTEKTNLE